MNRRLLVSFAFAALAAACGSPPSGEECHVSMVKPSPSAVRSHAPDLPLEKGNGATSQTGQAMAAAPETNMPLDVMQQASRPGAPDSTGPYLTSSSEMKGDTEVITYRWHRAPAVNVGAGHACESVCCPVSGSHGCPTTNQCT
jgi:hypothetical protein